MNFFFSFLVAGTVCAVGQIILDNTNLTPGHITSGFTVMGAVAGFFGLYDKLIEISGAGATILISNFGNALYNSGVAGYKSYGLIGIFKNLLMESSAIIVSAIVLAFFFSLIFKPKD